MRSRRNTRGGLRKVPAAAATPEDGSDSGHQFPRAEGLGHVVVRAKLQPHDPVGLLRLDRQQDHVRVSLRPEPPEDLQPVEPREEDIQDHDLRAEGAGGPHSRLPVRRPLDLEALPLEVGPQQLPDGLVVVHHEDAHHAIPMVEEERLPQ
jgi:hypothetical protein